MATVLYLLSVPAFIVFILWIIYTVNNPENDLYFEDFTYPIDRKLDKYLKKAIRSGIYSITIRDTYRSNIVFNDGTYGVIWNANKWYAWLTDGSLVSPNGDAYVWEDKRPTRWTMIKLKKAIEKYRKSCLTR